MYIQHLGGIDTAELNRVFPLERLKLALAVSADCVLRERFPACSEKAGRPIQVRRVADGHADPGRPQPSS